MTNDSDGRLRGAFVLQVKIRATLDSAVGKMSGFSEVAMRERLAKLRPQQDSINTLSLWLMHHHRHMDDIVQIWLKEVRKETNSSQIVNLLYVANDVIQNSRKKNPEFMTKFYGVLEPAFRHAAKISGPELDKAMIKTLNVWRDRQIYNEEQLLPYFILFAIESLGR
ncbi:unnamed protein product [Strongylus vulgaris]|uniref:CID domain-containing protein n=1 Tax=Strongylus vulgaris TaxID=40348 RepID=A0A3P7IJJ2_STRVU|nr:unnamed protein product [Strongylus vulgaris]